MADLQQIETVMAQLQNNYSELARTWFNIFYNTEPMDVDIKFYDENGDLQSYTIPNRAKDQKFIMNGFSNPEGNIVATPGTVFQDRTGGDLYVKHTGTSKTGWQRVIHLADLEDYIIRGNGAPSMNTTGRLGTLYVNTANGGLYIKALPTGNEAWQPIIDVNFTYFAHFVDLGETVVIEI